MAGRSSQILLDLEGKNSCTSSIDCALVVCKNDGFLQSQTQTTKTKPPGEKPSISSLPKSQVLGKVKDFLGVMSEANKRLQDNSKDYDIEVLAGNESEYIEMDLMLGVADLHTPESVAAAESAIAGYQQVIPSAASNSGVEFEDNSDDEEEDEDQDNIKGDDDDDNGTSSPTKLKRTEAVEDESSGEALRNSVSKKRPKIVELS